ncbi:MAG: NAD(P)H-dependent oxidoreductase [Gemmatimonadota bacterium]|jgi:NAD(P)H-dependent FMN reductase|nr:NAD(P)H-dependent oxidoreductase [Gemmatimonadota bacterium]
MKPRIAIIISTTRDTRIGDKAARWIADAAESHSEFEAEIVDIRDFDLPFFNEPASNRWVPSKDPAALRWQKKIGEFDGYIFVTAEYNHSISGALKNALDQAYVEWNRKAAAFVGYGGVGGARAVEHLRGICSELQMMSVQSAIHVGGADFMGIMQGQKSFSDLSYMDPMINGMFADLLWWVKALKTARAATAAG